MMPRIRGRSLRGSTGVSFHDSTDMKIAHVRTTVRLNDRVYRKAKAEADPLGVTLTEFIERALNSEIQRSATLSAVSYSRSFRGWSLLLHF